MMISGEHLPGHVKAVIEDCGYTSVKEELAHQVKQLFPYLPVKPMIAIASRLCEQKAGHSFEEASALNSVKKFQAADLLHSW